MFRNKIAVRRIFRQWTRQSFILEDLCLCRVNCKSPVSPVLHTFLSSNYRREKETVIENSTSLQAPGNLCAMSPLQSTVFILSFQLFLLGFIHIYRQYRVRNCDRRSELIGKCQVKRPSLLRQEDDVDRIIVPHSSSKGIPKTSCLTIKDAFLCTEKKPFLRHETFSL